jgi:hypothetical protein
VITKPAGFQVHALALQFRQPQQFPLNEPDPFPIQHLLLGIGCGIEVARIRRVSVAVCRPKALVFPPAVDPQIPCDPKDPPAGVIELHSISQTAMKAEKSFLSDFFGQRVIAS